VTVTNEEEFDVSWS